MTNTYSRPAQKLDLRRRVKSVLERLSSCAPHSSHEQVSCFRNHRILTSQINNQAMSIGCFGECSFGSDSSDSSNISNRENHGRKVHIHQARADLCSYSEARQLTRAVLLPCAAAPCAADAPAHGKRCALGSPVRKNLHFIASQSAFQHGPKDSGREASTHR